MLKRHFCVIKREILDLFQTGPSMKKLHDDAVKASNLFVCSDSDKQEKKFYNFDIWFKLKKVFSKKKESFSSMKYEVSCQKATKPFYSFSMLWHNKLMCFVMTNMYSLIQSLFIYCIWVLQWRWHPWVQFNTDLFALNTRFLYTK
jgi:hypothetical protein